MKSLLILTLIFIGYIHAADENSYTENDLLNDIAILNDSSIPIYTNYTKVKIIYLIPSDRKENNDYTKALKDTYKNIQNWFLRKLQYQRTFTFLDENSVVSIIKSTHEEQWFTTENENAEGVWVLYFNALNDAISIMGEKPSDEIWMIYLAADIKGDDCGVIEGGGGAAGSAVMSEDDLRGLAKYDNFSCDYEANYYPGRWIGGGAHELGHAFGLNHPEPEENTLMGYGYDNYPNTELTETSKQLLNESDSLSSLSAINLVFDNLEKEYGLDNEQTRKYSDNQKEIYYRYYTNGTYILEKDAKLYVYYNGNIIAKGLWLDKLRSTGANLASVYYLLLH